MQSDVYSKQKVNEKILEPDFYNRNTELVAQELLGNILVHRTGKGVLRGRIVETEAYFGKNDPASHAATKGKTNRNSIMFGKPGVAYIYLNYGVHYLFNIVTEPEGIAGAVLVRALEPLEGFELMMDNRQLKSEANLTNGPGKLTKAMGIDINANGLEVTDGKLYIAKGETNNFIVKRATRIGISVAQDRLLRYYIESNPFVSRS